MSTDLVNFTFITLGIITVGSAFLVVTLRNLIHCALMLGVSFIGVAGLYLLLNAEFIAAAQVLVYVGAITVLVLFAIMLTQGLTNRSEAIATHYQVWTGATVAFLGFALVGTFLWRHAWPAAYGNVPDPPAHTTHLLGIQLITTYIVPFEVASVLFLMAMVAAIVLARGEIPASVESLENALTTEDAGSATAETGGTE